MGTPLFVAVPEERRKELERAAAEWDRLAADPYTGNEALRRSCANTAEAMRLEIETGQWHCSCCLKPMGKR